MPLVVKRGAREDRAGNGGVCRQRKALALVHEAGRRAAVVVTDLLTVARGVASVRETANLNRVIRDYLISPENKRLMELHPHVSVRTELDLGLRGRATYEEIVASKPRQKAINASGQGPRQNNFPFSGIFLPRFF